MNTLLLDADTWDLVVNDGGNIATAYGSAPTQQLSERPAYAIAQDVASACRVFLGELWYATGRGVPYLQAILGKLPSIQFIKAKLIGEALTVPETATVRCFLTGLDPQRGLSGQLQVTDTRSKLTVVTIGSVDNALPWYVSAVSP